MWEGWSREGDCVSKCGCLEIGLPPCQMIKMFPLTFIFPGILPMYNELHVNEYAYEFIGGYIECDLRNGWRCNLHVALVTKIDRELLLHFSNLKKKRNIYNFKEILRFIYRQP